MKISKIYIKNYRALDELELDLCDDMNLLYGANGTGKSSIIYALYDLFVQINNKELKSQQPDPTFMLHRARNDDEDVIIEVEFDNGFNAIAVYNENKIKDDHEDKIYQNIIESNDNLFIATSNKSIVEFYSCIPNITCDDTIVIGESVLTHRTQMEHVVPFEFKLIKRPIYVPGRGIMYDRFKRMFKEREDLEYQEIVESIRTNKYRDPVLEKIRSGIKEIFDFTGIKVERKEKDFPVKIEKNGIWLRLDSHLSSGEANIVALLSSIALETAISNIQTILIDEIENSLHAHAQYLICGTLKRLFPDVQFVISSHSPYICSGLHKEQIVFLEHDKDNHNKIARRDIDHVPRGNMDDMRKIL